MSDAITDRPAQLTGPPATSRFGLILLLLCLAQFMVVLDIMAMQVALPQIGQSLHMGRESLTWVITAYTVTFGGLLIFGGRLADAAGRKTTFLIGLAVFTAASLTAGLASTGGMLLGSRVAQGVGAAILSPSALSILTTEFTGKHRNHALGIWGAIAAAGAAVGVVVGGALTSGPGWEWVFFINVPVGLIVLIVVPMVVPARPRVANTRVDYIGAVLGTAAVGLVIYGLVKAGEKGWSSADTLVPVAAGLILAAAFVFVESRSVAPLVPLKLIRRPPLPGAVLAMVLATAVLLGMYFVSSVYLQEVKHYSALKTGLSFLPVAMVTGVGAHLASGHLAKVGARPIAMVSMVLSAIGLTLMATVGVGGGVLTALLPAAVLSGLGLGAMFVTAVTSGLATAEPEVAGVSSGIVNTGHELGASLGVAIISTIAASSVGHGPAASLDGFRHAYIAAAVGALVLAVAGILLLPKGKLVVRGDAPVFGH